MTVLVLAVSRSIGRGEDSSDGGGEGGGGRGGLGGEAQEEEKKEGGEEEGLWPTHSPPPDHQLCADVGAGGPTVTWS